MYNAAYAYPHPVEVTPLSLVPDPIPLVHTNTYRPNRGSRKGLKQEVFPFKSQRDIDAMQQYFLNAAISSKTVVKKASYLNDFLFFTLGINVGYRVGDFLHLRWKDILVAAPNITYVTPELPVIDDSYVFITEEKTGKHRQLVFNDDCRRAIAFYLVHVPLTPALDEYLFYSSFTNRTEPMKSETIIRHLKEAASAVGITYNVGTHSLRKTFGYRYYKATNDLTTLQKIFNHSSPAITLAYIGITNEDIYNAYSKVNGAVLSNEELERIMARDETYQANWFTKINQG